MQIDWTIAPPAVNRTPSSISPLVTPEAAKIISLQRPDVREKLRAIGKAKRKTYTPRDLVREVEEAGL